MDDLARKKLYEIVGQYGQQAYSNPQLCADLLEPLHADFPREISALIDALVENVPANLVTQSDQVQKSLLVMGLTKRLQEKIGLEQEEAKWAVESWGLALGVLARQEDPIDALKIEEKLDCPYLDLAIIIDTIGDDLVLQSRRTFVQNLIEAIRQGISPKTGLRVAILAYGDYNHIQSRFYENHPPPLLQHDLGEVSEAIQALNSLDPISGQDFEAALEDALAALKQLQWHPESLRVAVTIGSRPPHPLRPQPGRRQLASPAGYDWREILGRAQEQLELHSVGVLWPIFWPSANIPEHAASYVRTCWEEIGFTALFDYHTTSPAQVARAILTTETPQPD